MSSLRMPSESGHPHVIAFEQDLAAGAYAHQLVADSLKRVEGSEAPDENEMAQRQQDELATRGGEWFSRMSYGFAFVAGTG